MEKLSDRVAPPSYGTPLPISPGFRPASTPRSHAARHLVVWDALSAIAAVVIAKILLEVFNPQVAQGFLVMAPFAPLAWIGSFQAFGLYHVGYLPAVEEFRRLISASTVATALTTVAGGWATATVYRKGLAVTWVFSVLFALAGRRLWSRRLRRLRRQGRLLRRTLIVGAGDEGRQLGDLLKNPDFGFLVVGWIGTVVPDRGVQGVIDDLRVALDQTGAETVFITTDLPASAIADILRLTRRYGAELRMVTGFSDVLASRISVTRVGKKLAVCIRPLGLTPAQEVLKRAFDIAMSSVLLLLALPLLGIIALSVRLSSPGPAIYKQSRITKDGQPFTMYKFRTMLSEDRIADAVRTINLTGAFFKMENDPRLTRLGRFLRRTSLDELPQLWNVLKGDLSLVGPRPLPAVQVAANEALLRERHEVRAGITGWWQVNGRSGIPAEDAVELDRFYIENWSMSLDMYILARTLGAVVARRGAY